MLTNIQHVAYGHKKLAQIGVGSKFRAGLAIYKISEKGNPFCFVNIN